MLAVFSAVRSAADRARRGEGPSLIEAVTYRMGAHTSADDPTRYRLDSDLAPWSSRDPIETYAAWLRSRALLDEGQADSIEAEAEGMAEAMRGKLRRLPQPSPAASLFDRVYHDPPASFIKEREEFEATLEPVE